jgi:hypothetical protein
MAVIGATQLEPVNILGSYVQGLEAGRGVRAQRLKEQQELAAAQRELEFRNYLSSADLSTPEAQNQLLRFGKPGADVATSLADIASKRATMRGTELGNAEKAAALVASQAGAFLSNPTALNKTTLAPWVAQSVQSGLLSPETAAMFDAAPDDPKVLALGLQQIQRAALTAAQQTEQTFTSQNLGGGVRVLATPTRGGGPATVVPGSQASVTLTPYERQRLDLERQQEARLAAAENRAAQGELNVVARTETAADGTVRFYNKFGTLLKSETGAGKPSATFEKTKAARENMQRDLAEVTANLREATKEGGLIDQSTGSGFGRGVDVAAGFFGKATEGAIATGKLQPLADQVLKLVPRFEGPQSDKDTQSYREAAGQLADSTLPNEIRKEAGKTILKLMERRQGQFAIGDAGATDSIFAEADAILGSQ